ncbi:hypothetical protein FPS14_contig00031-0029 [Flavobacterium psychrophilum]|nr:hypothetical protein FPS14_contig00031-0029 [Flavobacterium psychrophilum]
MVKEAIYVKYDSFFELKNSVISGFNQFLLLENKAILNSNLNKLKFENLVLNNCKAKVELETNTPDKLLEEWIANDSFNIITSNTERKKIFEESDIKKNPDFRLKDNNSGTLVVK